MFVLCLSVTTFYTDTIGIPTLGQTMDSKKEPRVVERTVSFDPFEPETMQAREAREHAEMKLESGTGSERSSLNDPDWRPGYMNRFP